MQDSFPRPKIAYNVPVYLTFAAERSESEPGLQEFICTQRIVEGSSVPQMCPQPGAVRAFLIYKNSRASGRSEQMEAKPKWFAERARTEHRRRLARRGAERVNFS